MENYKLGDLVQVRKSQKHSSYLPVPNGSIGLITEIKDNLMDGITYIVMFSEEEKFLMYQDEFIKI